MTKQEIERVAEALRPPTEAEINQVADAIADLQYCGSCAGTTPETAHCKACTEEATLAVSKFLEARRVTLLAQQETPSPERTPCPCRKALEAMPCHCKTVPVGICPQCGGELFRVRNTSSYLNDDQFDAVRAGDFYCINCKGKEAASGYKYFWERDLQGLRKVCPRCAALASPCSCDPLPVSEIKEAI